MSHPDPHPAGNSTAETPHAIERRPYEPPHLRALGTLQQLTQGDAGGGSDGINPGSLFGR